MSVNIQAGKKAPIGQFTLEADDVDAQDTLVVRVQEHNGTSWNTTHLIASVRANATSVDLAHDLQGRLNLKKHTGNVAGSQRLQARIVADSGASLARKLNFTVELYEKS